MNKPGFFAFVIILIILGVLAVSGLSYLRDASIGDMRNGVTQSAPSTSASVTYSNVAFGIELNYPSSTFTVVPTTRTYYWRYPYNGGYNSNGLSLLALRSRPFIYKIASPGPALLYVTLGVSTDEQDKKECMANSSYDYNTVASTTTIINGIAFHVDGGDDVTTGEIDSVVSLRTLHDNTCYALEMDINAGTKMPSEPQQAAFDQLTYVQEAESFYDIASSFRFTR